LVFVAVVGREQCAVADVVVKDVEAWSLFSQSLSLNATRSLSINAEVATDRRSLYPSRLLVTYSRATLTSGNSAIQDGTFDIAHRDFGAAPLQASFRNDQRQERQCNAGRWIER
jgi:hypothetical protein